MLIRETKEGLAREDAAGGEGCRDTREKLWATWKELRMEDAVLRTQDRVMAKETAWAHGNNRWNKRAVFRGLDATQVQAIVEGNGMRTERNTGGLAEHIRAVKVGSSDKTTGLSLSKDPYIAHAYASGKEGGGMVCVRWVELEAAGMIHDLSDIKGQEAMSALGADRTTMKYAEADAEVRYYRSIEQAQITETASYGRILRVEEAHRDRTKGNKRGHEMRLDADTRSRINLFAMECEGETDGERRTG